MCSQVKRISFALIDQFSVSVKLQSDVIGSLSLGGNNSLEVIDFVIHIEIKVFFTILPIGGMYFHEFEIFCRTL